MTVVKLMVPIVMQMLAFAYANQIIRSQIQIIVTKVSTTHSMKTDLNKRLKIDAHKCVLQVMYNSESMVSLLNQIKYGYSQPSTLKLWIVVTNSYLLK